MERELIMKRLLTWTCVISLALITPATAAVSQGDTELDVLGGWMNFDAAAGGGLGGTDVTNWFLIGRVGYFATNEIQLGASVMGAWIDTAMGDGKLYGVGGTAKYHFMTNNQTVPYVGAQIFWVRLEDGAGTDGWMWGPLVGLRYELNPYNDLFVEYQYQDYQDAVGDAINT
jgi:hypothetical protein